MYNLEDHVDELIAAHYYLLDYHEGQWSAKYSLLSRSPYTPGRIESKARLFEENPEIGSIYDDLVRMADKDVEALVTKWFEDCANGGDDHENI